MNKGFLWRRETSLRTLLGRTPGHGMGWPHGLNGKRTSVRIAEMNWMQVEEYLKTDDRAVVPLGSTEQHAYLSLLVDALIPERLAVEVTKPLGVPVFPVIPFGLSPYFSAFPGTVTLRVETYARVIRDVLDSLSRAGFRRILLLNGHGGNAPAGSVALEWMAENPGHQVKLFNWWIAPETLAKIREVDPVGSHASWMENFPWTRLADVPLPSVQKAPIDGAMKSVLDSEAFKEYLGDGNFGGYYQRPDEEMMAIWDVAIAEATEVLEEGWA
jgi:creatinine amidohydrolase